MALVQSVDNGKIVNATGSASEKSDQSANKAKSSGSTLGKDAFLQLLVAQMKYQDPLEPTDNTEYVAQLATFSQLEETQNQTAVLREQNADSLIGKNVVVRTTNAGTGEINEDAGMVEYVQRESSKVYVFVNGTKYNYEDVYQVLDNNYLDAISLAKQLTDVVDLLPSVADCSLSHKTQVDKAVQVYNSMNAYQQSFVSKETTDKLEALADKLSKLGADEEKLDKKDPDDKTQETQTDTSDKKEDATESA
ncbi:MAG: flagellar hook assembly protein FlgD [Lachnospiraceae bacterium]